MMPAEPKPPCVLLVEDHTTLRQSLSIHFEKEQINVDVAEDGAEAMRLLELRSYDVVVLDLNLPRVSGRELLDYLALNRNHQSPSIVVITAEELDSNRGTDLSLVARTFVKPLDFAAVARAVHELCIEKGE